MSNAPAQNKPRPARSSHVANGRATASRRGKGPRIARPTRVFVHGALLAGEIHHHLLGGAPLVGVVKTKPKYTLRDNGGGALLSPDGEQAVFGELYDIDATALAAIDEHEDHPKFHRRTTIELDDGSKADAWLLPTRWADHRDVVVSGSWRAHLDACYNRRIEVEVEVGEFAVKEAIASAIGHGRIPRWAQVVAFRARPEVPSDDAMPQDVPFILELVEHATGRTISLKHQWSTARSFCQSRVRQARG